MPIEFRCKQCLHPQEVDDSKIGQHVYCKVCYVQLTVPVESTNKPVDESQLYSLNAQQHSAQQQGEQDRQELISMSCSVCHTNIGVRKEQVGEEIVCPECGTTIIVPESIAKIADARRIDKLDKVIAATRYKETYSLHDGTTALTTAVLSEDGVKQFRFHCQLCGTALFATKEQIGTLVNCSDCETKTKALPQTRKSKPAPPPPPSTFEGETIYEVASPSRMGATIMGAAIPEAATPGAATPATKSASAASHENLVPVVCHFCGTRMHAEASQIGEFKTCPDCEQETEIKAAPKQHKTTTSTTSADAYKLGEIDAPTHRPTAAFFTSLSPSMLRKRLNEQETSRSFNRPPLPKRPFTERFFVPFGHFSTWFPLLVFVAIIPLGAIFMSWVTGLAAGGNRVGTFGLAIFTLFFGSAVFAVYAAAFGYFVSFLVHFYSFTSSGMDEEEFQGELVLFDYFIYALWIVTFSFVAVLPGWFFGHFLAQLLGFSNDYAVTGVLLIVMMRISHWLFFPIFFLSSMESGSMLAILAKNTILSLYRQSYAWLRFYLLTAVLFLLADLCLVGALWFASAEAPVGIAIFLFLVAIQSLFFFRLLGRLAWLLEETDRREREREFEEE